MTEMSLIRGSLEGFRDFPEAATSAVGARTSIFQHTEVAAARHEVGFSGSGSRSRRASYQADPVKIVLFPSGIIQQPFEEFRTPSLSAVVMDYDAAVPSCLRLDKDKNGAFAGGISSKSVALQGRDELLDCNRL